MFDSTLDLMCIAALAFFGTLVYMALFTSMGFGLFHLLHNPPVNVTSPRFVRCPLPPQAPLGPELEPLSYFTPSTPSSTSTTTPTTTSTTTTTTTPTTTTTTTTPTTTTTTSTPTTMSTTPKRIQQVQQNGKAEQSSLKHNSTDYSAEKALDGDLDTSAETSQEPDTYPWWRVALIKVYEVTKVEMDISMNASDNQDFEVRVGNVSKLENGIKSKTVFTDNEVCGTKKSFKDDVTNYVMICEKLIYGKYMTIQKTQNQYVFHNVCGPMN
uniref:Fucolectin tachylectin-4 pentraxin-1 domain-containing protein n=1 Tax=Strigamia maritima TaxID=126957 RepID=T1J6G5_STRMM